ncbi:MAG: LPS assembly protein LptD [Desulfotalea sp.]
MLDLFTRHLTKNKCTIIVPLVLALTPSIATANGKTNIDDWQLIAESIIELPQEEGLIASGKVELLKNGQIISGDWLSYDKITHTIKLKGNTQLNKDSYSDLLIKLLGEPTSDGYNKVSTIDSWQVSSTDTLKEAPVSNEPVIAATIDEPSETVVPVIVDTSAENHEETPNKIPNKEKTPLETETPIPSVELATTETKPAERPDKSKKDNNKELSTEEWDISADKIFRYENPSSIVAVGNVVLIKKELVPPQNPKNVDQTNQWDDLLGEAKPKPQKQQETKAVASKADYQTRATIYTDWLSYDVDKGIITAKGNIRIDGEDSQILAEKATLMADNETGTFENASMQNSDMMYMEGAEISKTGPDTFRLVDGWVITCKLEEGQEPPWAIVSAETDVRKEGYAVLKHARFHVKGIPIFYTPYLIVPVKETRQTGFLFPEISQSSNKGVGINTPFFWAISETTDATFYPQYYTDRGFMPGAEFRYVASATEKGSIDATYLSDRQDSSETNYTYQDNERYWIRGKADHTFGDNWLARVDIDYVSDRDFLKEFNSGLNSLDANEDLYLDNFGRGFSDEDETLRENSIKIMHNWDHSFLELNLLAINDVRADQFGNKIKDKHDKVKDNPFWKLPSISYTGALPIPNVPVTFDWDTSYVNFWREDGYGGHRINIDPSFSAGLPISQYIEASTKIGASETFYMVENYGTPIGSDAWTDSDDQKNRLMYNFELEFATTMERDYFSTDSENSGFNHLIRPYVRYNLVPEEDQSDLPFFDEDDRINEENGITYGFDTYVNLFGTDDKGGSTNSQYLHLEMYQTYRLADLNNYNEDTGVLTIEDDEFSEVNAKVKWYPWRNTYVGYKTEYDPNGDGFTNHTFTGSTRTDSGHSATLEYNYEEGVLEEINGYFTFKINSNWLARLEIEHSLYDDETHEIDFGITYLQPCWSMTLGYQHTPDDDSVTAMFELANIGVGIGI